MIDSIINAFESPLGSFKSESTDSLDYLKGIVRKEMDHAYLCQRHLDMPKSEGSLTMGIVFSGGPAPGGHDVICGILAHLRPQDQLIGFRNGPGGLLSGQHQLISSNDMDHIEGLGGFDFLGTDRTKISTTDQFDQVGSILKALNITTLFIVGGDDSNTNALFLADALFGQCNVIGVPKTIDGDLQFLPQLPISFGFHTATQHYSQLVEQLAIDSKATRKYWHIVKLMGRSASHVTLEVALQVKPHACILSEEIVANGQSLMDVIRYFSNVIIQRYQEKQPYGVIVFPEGIADVIPEFRDYAQGRVDSMNKVLAALDMNPIQLTEVYEDEHGNKNLSTFNTEKLMMDLIQGYLSQKGVKSDAIKMVSHFFGYTGRAENPTSFDSAYSLLLGKTAYELGLSNETGVVVGCDFYSSIVLFNFKIEDNLFQNTLPIPPLLAFSASGMAMEIYVIIIFKLLSSYVLFLITSTANSKALPPLYYCEMDKF